VLQAFDHRFAGLLNLIGWFSLFPGILGVLLAAPLVLELEQGTYRRLGRRASRAGAG
jgi:hypothetical protein